MTKKGLDRYVISTETNCWLWQGSLKNGYGQIGIYIKGKVYNRRAHVLMYEKYIGPVPEGLQLDHLCRNRNCVNPYHLEPVTNQQNVRRGNSTKLTKDQICQIRQLKGVMSAQKVTKKLSLNISGRHIYDIWADKLWSDIQCEG